jgi:hypothetical protein
MNFEVIGQQLIIYSAFVRYLRKKLKYSKSVHQLL